MRVSTDLSNERDLGSYYCFFPVRDGEKTISLVLDSLIAQTYPPSKIIVVNDGSTDRTSMVLKEFQHTYGSYLEVINTDSTTRDYKRIPLLWNRCLRREYDYHMIGAGDVTFANNYSEKVLSHMNLFPETVVCSGDYGEGKASYPHGAGRFVRQSFFFQNYSEYPSIVGYESEILWRAKMRDYKAEILNYLKFNHLDPLGHSHNFVEFGYSMRSLGYYFPYVVGRCLLQFVRNREIGMIGSLNMFKTYVTFKPETTGYYSLFPQEVRKYVKDFQKKAVRRKIKSLITFQ